MNPVETATKIAFANSNPKKPAKGPYGSPIPEGRMPMTEKWKEEKWAEDFWYAGKVSRRKFVGWGGGAIGAMMLVPAPWRAAFGQARSYKIGSEQPLSGPGAPGGKTAVVGLQMAVDRINKNGGVNGRPFELVIVDDESKPDVARRKTEKIDRKSVV